VDSIGIKKAPFPGLWGVSVDLAGPFETLGWWRRRPPKKSISYMIFKTKITFKFFVTRIITHRKLVSYSILAR
jgi:hypothetical protein